MDVVVVTWARTCRHVFTGTDAMDRAMLFRAGLLDRWPTLVVNVRGAR
jgi:hypothetical protein